MENILSFWNFCFVFQKY